MGANPPRRVGVLVGDAECYTVFKELLDPIISEYHGIDSYEEWMDPELPMESYFRKMAHLKDSTSSDSGTTTFGATHDNNNNNNNFDVMKSHGADDDSDNDGDSFFFLDEEGDLYEEDVILLPTTTTTSTTSPSSHTTSQSATTSSMKPTTSTSATKSSPTAPSHVEAIASKRKTHLRRHPTIINNPRLVTNRVADPDGNYIVSTRIRVARSLDGMRFPSSMSRADRRYIERLIGECTRNFHSPKLAYGSYISVLSMTNDMNLDLIERHILFDNPHEWRIASGLGRDWPDGRALYANVTNVQSQTPDFMIWVNEEDHLRIMCLRSGGDIQGVFTTLWNGLHELERELSIRGWHFCYDARYGYLTSCPTNAGTAMRASVHVRLVNLGRLPGFFELVERLKLEVRGVYGETDRHYTGIFDISNAERLGKSEVHLINVMVDGVAKLIELERKLEAGEQVDICEIARS
jgi:protein-arginine kinase